MTALYESVRDELDTGDIVLFSGKGLISAGIKWSTSSRWSHVGMILKLPEYDFVTVWESTTLSSTNDLDTNSARKGVQLVPLSARISDYDGAIAIRRLLGAAHTGDSVKSLMQFRREVAGRPYEESELELIKSAYDGPLGKNKEDLSSLFCSELVAEAYQRMGLVTYAKASNEYTPADFSEKNQLALISGALGEELIIKDD